MVVLTLLVLAGGDPGPAVDWAPLYRAAGVDPARAGVDLTWLETYGRGAYRNPLFEALMRDPERVPAVARITGAGLVASAPSLFGSLHRTGSLAGWGVRRGLAGSVVEQLRRRVDPQQPLLAAIGRVRGVAGMVATDPADPRADDLPQPLQEALALVLVAVAEVPTWRGWAFENAPAQPLDKLLDDLRRGVVPGDEQSATAAAELERRIDRIVAGFDPAALSACAGDLTQALDEAKTALAGLDLTGVAPRRWVTPLGDVVLAGRGDDRWGDEVPLLLVDVGGNDTYQNGAVAAADDRPVSILLDLAGDDTYDAGDRALSWGVGLGGIGILIDLAGRDTYRGGSVSQGAGVAGIGLLWDGAGDDTYEATAHAQGAGVWGTGSLVDGAGNDRYHAVQYSQGYGYTLGAGTLTDVAGEDVYIAEDQAITVPSPQTAEHNASLSQGFGFGRRADYTNGRSLAGGVGWLADGGGNDSYSCGVFGQGGGYWMGVGGLTDLAGDDRYQGVWYVQGAAAHYALGALADLGGADRYTATMNMAQGAGHDFSLGWLADLAGDDRYQAPNLALGAGNANGVGYFLELAGDDTYEAADGVNLGRAAASDPRNLVTSTRQFVLTAGWFLDAAGRDTYPRAECGDGKEWRLSIADQQARGAGADR